MKAAVIYYSQYGTTKAIAEKVAATFNADIYLVEPEKDYGGFMSAVARVVKERIKKETPSFTTPIADFAPYDTVFIGFPVWAGTLPQFLQDYISTTNIGKKHVIPFGTAGGTGKEGSLKTIKELLPEAEITDYFFSSKAQRGDVDAWLKEIDT